MSSFRVLAATSSYPRESVPFAGSFVQGWRVALERCGHEVSVLRPHDTQGPTRDKKYQRIGKLLSGHGAPEMLTQQPFMGALNGLLQTRSMSVALRECSSNYDLFVGHWLLPWGLLKLPFPKVHLYAHGSDVALLESLPPLLGRTLSRFIERSVNGITFVSDDLMKRFDKISCSQAGCSRSVIPMGVETDDVDKGFERWLCARFSNERRLNLATLGRLTPIKGIRFLLRALEDCSKVRLLVAGDGPCRQELETLANELSLDVTFLGALNSAQKNALLRHVDLLVQPSIQIGQRREGQPVSTLEALNVGCPVLASRTGGLISLSQNGGLNLVTPGDTRELRQEIRKYQSDPAELKRLKITASAHMGRWSWSHLISAHEAVLLDSTQPF